MSDFLIFHTKIQDDKKFRSYVQQVGPTLPPFGGEAIIWAKAHKGHQ